MIIDILKKQIKFSLNLKFSESYNSKNVLNLNCLLKYTSGKFKPTTTKYGTFIRHGASIVVWISWKTSADIKKNSNQTIFKGIIEVSEMEKTPWNSINQMGLRNLRKFSWLKLKWPTIAL